MNKHKANITTARIIVEWKKSRMWGHNPHLEGWSPEKYPDPCYYKGTVSGCGYDKFSAVVAGFLNWSPIIRAKMQELTAFPRERNGRSCRPYGFGYDDNTATAEGGVGIGSLIEGLKAIGLRVRHTSGDSSDHITIDGDWTPRKSLAFVEVSYIHGDGSLGAPEWMSLEQYKNHPYGRENYKVLRKFRRSVRKPQIKKPKRGAK